MIFNKAPQFLFKMPSYPFEVRYIFMYLDDFFLRLFYYLICL